MTTTYKHAQTNTVDVGGARFAYRQLGADTGLPVIFLVHLAGNLDNWDPRVVDGIAARHRVVTFDNRGVGASTGKTPDTIHWEQVLSSMSTRASTRSISRKDGHYPHHVKTLRDDGTVADLVPELDDIWSEHLRRKLETHLPPLPARQERLSNQSAAMSDFPVCTVACVAGLAPATHRL